MLDDKKIKTDIYISKKNSKKAKNNQKVVEQILKLPEKNKKAEYTIKLIEDTLQDHLIEIDKASAERYNLLMKQFAEKENITEDLKATNQLEWVGKMKANKNAVEEIILKELIYV